MAATIAVPAGRAAYLSKCSCHSPHSPLLGQHSMPGTPPVPPGSQRLVPGWPRCASLISSFGEGTLGCLSLTLDIASGVCSASLVQNSWPQAMNSCFSRHLLQLPGPYLPRPVLPREHRPQCSQATSVSRGSLTPRAFVEDDQPFPATVTQRDMAELSLRARLESKYSSQLGAGIISTFGRHDLLQRKRDLKESFGGSPPGGGKNNGRGRGDGGGGGGGGGEGQTAIYLLPVLTLVFAAVFLGYAVAVGLKEEGMNMDFLRTSAGLFGLLALAAFRVNNQTGIDAFILGLGASTAVMVWTGERFVVRKEIAPAGIVTFLAASMAVIFTGALYHSL